MWFHGMDRATTRQTPQQLALDIHERITSVLRLCTKVMFVFDDADLFPAAVIDALGNSCLGSREWTERAIGEIDGAEQTRRQTEQICVFN